MLTVHAGALVLVFLLLSLLILGCRRRRRAKVTPKVMVPNFSGQPQPFPSTWQGQQPVQTPYYGPDVGWVYQAPSTAAPYERAKSTELGQAQRIGPSRQAPSTTPFGEVLGASTLGQVVQRPPPTNQVGGAPDSGQVQTPAPTSQVESTTPPGRAQRYVPSGQVQSIASSVREQQQGAPIPPPPRRTPQGIPSAGASNDRDQSPPPYYPVSRAFFLACFTLGHTPS